ncbi:uncharacterized protein LOC132866265 [Neoarius graeffei]|uniref:uncharacterized protein LOC132866265 n=1 Tax=Neoarius graeffei TaxID=443677 RepID=UPI00298BE70C|nr:uncharacterized protein LOC132866265 [Neoarius graeffei]
MAATTRGKTDSLVWTDDEVELLLRVTLKYKTSKYQENVDWETCQTKYGDIALAFWQQYTPGDMAAGKDFPHDPSNISKAQITAKLKGIRNKYRHAIDSGRRSGHGRVVLIFFELCEEIWGGSPGTDSIPSGIESADMVEDSASSSTSDSPWSPVELEVSPASTAFNPSAAEVNRRRNLLQAKLDSHRGDRLKRKAPADAAVQEDLQIKRRMLQLMEESEKRASENLERVNNNIELLTNTIKNGFELLQTLVLQQQPQAPAPHP